MERTVIKDIIHNQIYIEDEIILDLIETPEFQRLQRIKQLGFCYFVYPNATHTRFTHSLGTYYIAYRILNDLEKTEQLKLSKYERILTLITALLHDIGHSAFSHSFEMINDKKHEDWTEEIILGNTNVNNSLKKYNEKLPEDIIKVLNKKYNNDIINNLISNQVDVDRMDYLLRDSKICGVAYGQYDLERIIKSLEINNKKITFDYESRETINHYLASRIAMYNQVYLHRVSQSADVIFQNLFSRLREAKDKVKFMPKIIKQLLNNSLTLNNFLKIDDSYINYCLREWTKEKDKIVFDLAYRLLNRKLFKEVDINQQEKVLNLLENEGFNIEYYYNPLKTIINTKKEKIKINKDNKMYSLNKFQDNIFKNKKLYVNRLLVPEIISKNLSCN